MKKLFIFLFFINIWFIHAQNSYKAIYKIQIDEAKFSALLYQEEGKEAYNQLIKKMFEAANATEFSLTFNAEKSVFAVEEKLGIDDMQPKIAKGMLATFDLQDNIYASKANEKFYLKRVAGSSTHFVGRPYNYINWKLTNHTKQYKKYTLTKATATIAYPSKTPIEVHAWFCKAIPTAFGPGLFSGLPGLIMLVEVNEKTKKGLSYTLELQSLKADKTKDIYIPIDKYEVLTEEESEAIYEKMNGNFRSN